MVLTDSFLMGFGYDAVGNQTTYTNRAGSVKTEKGSNYNNDSTWLQNAKRKDNQGGTMSLL